MTREELDSFEEFRGLKEYDGNNLELTPPQPQPGHVIHSAMNVDEARQLLAHPRCSPQYVERHTGDDRTVGYEVIFWEERQPNDKSA